jgi:branched-chain amino acid transport system ATP-binding protein
MSTLLEIENIVVRYGKALALDRLSLRVEPNELVAVLGSNGAGKTTLLKAIARTVPLSSGHIRFKGSALDRRPAHEVVGLGAYLRSDRAGIARDLERVYALFPVLQDRSTQQASTLSGGEQQMLAVGRALMGKPMLLLLDEPSVGIAHRLKIEIFQAIRAIQQAGTAVLLVEQDAQSALSIAERAYVLEHGCIVREGRARELTNDDDIRRVYLGL